MNFSQLTNFLARLARPDSPLNVIFLMAVVSSSSVASAKESCGKVQIDSAIGPCISLTVRFNISDCESGRPLRAATVACSGNVATATLKTSEALYSVKLKETKDEWGAIQWKTEGALSRSLLKTASRMTKPVGTAPSLTRNETAQTAAEKALVVSPDSPSETGFNITANFDAYYAFNFNNPRPVPSRSNNTPGSTTLPPGNIGTRYYDIYHNQFALNLAELSLTHKGEEVSFLLDLDFGQFADQNVYAGSSDGSLVIDEVSKHIGQAYVTYTPSNIKGLTFDFGKLPTHVGLELMKAKDNWQYSRSTTFGFGGPFWHTGLHVGYATSPFLTAGLYIYNGWNSIYDSNNGKTVGTQLRFAPSDNLIIVYNFITGPEQTNDRNYKTVHEANITYTPNSRLAIAADVLVGWEENPIGLAVSQANWFGATLATKHQITSTYYLSPRVEYFKDSDGLPLGAPQTLVSATLTNEFAIAPGFELKLEGRIDRSTDADEFATHDGTSSTQTTITSALLVSL